MKHALFILLCLAIFPIHAFANPFMGLLAGSPPVASSGTEILTPSVVSPAWNKAGGATDLITVTDSSDLTYFYYSSTSAFIVITMPNVVGAGSIDTVKMCARFAVAAGSPAPRLGLYNGSSFKFFSPDPIVVSGSSFVDYCSTAMAKDPYTTADWVTSNLNGYSWRVSSGAVGSMTIQCSKVWAEVTFK